MKIRALVSIAMLFITAPLWATESTDSQDELAKKLANPIASLISVPIQMNYDDNMGLSQDGSQWKINIQPVIPFTISDDWNVITRTILPLLDQQDIPVTGQGEFGLGDIVASQFFSPKAVTSRGWTWGVGPVWLLPSATEDSLGGEKWGVGPTGVALRQVGHWTYGGLFNHIWSFAGDDNRADVNATFLQPFVAYLITRTHTTFTVNTESTYDWETQKWSIPINFSVAQMLKIGGMPMQVMLGARYWADSPDGGPEDWGARFQFTFLFPK